MSDWLLTGKRTINENSVAGPPNQFGIGENSDFFALIANRDFAQYTKGSAVCRHSLLWCSGDPIEPGNSLSKERSDKLMYGCSLDPDRINRQAYSKIIIDLVDQVARFRRLCK